MKIKGIWMCGEDKFGSQLHKQHKDDRRNEHLKWLSVCALVGQKGATERGRGVVFRAYSNLRSFSFSLS